MSGTESGTVSSPLPERASDTSAERPWPVRLLSYKIGEYVDRMPQLWVEGQVVQLTRRPGNTTCYLTLRDPDVDMSLSVTISAYALDAMPVPLRDGARVVVQAKPTFWARRGSLHLDGRQIRPVGQGELLARLEHLKQVLAAEGLFAPERKRRLPFLPRGVGLICGRASAAERDVVENARRRWPGVRFVVRQVPVQGTDAVTAVGQALAELDADHRVDVIVIARGGGSFEDLLPFSNEAMVRAVSSAVTPVVTAIGHDVDTPLVDFAADVRASTPTDAAKLVVPDVAAETAGLAAARARMLTTLTRRLAAERGAIAHARGRSTAAVARRLHTERTTLAGLRDRPVLARPEAVLTPHRLALTELVRRLRRAPEQRLDGGARDLVHLRARLRALAPGATLERGYAIVSKIDGTIVRDRLEVEPGELLRVRVHRGDFGVRPVS